MVDTQMHFIEIEYVLIQIQLKFVTEGIIRNTATLV